MKALPTKFASAERTLEKFLRQSFNDISSNSYINAFLNALPAIGVILNAERQVVFANKNLLGLLNIETMDTIIGKRPGEILRCNNSMKEIGGCGTSENCSVCGAVGAILESQKTEKVIKSECRISTDGNKSALAFDFSVEATPFTLNNTKYTIYTMVDVSDEKRRKALERIFFHDIINKAGNLNGLADLIKQIEDKDRIEELLDLVAIVSNEMLDEILAQRQLNSAENGELVLNISFINSFDTISLLAKQISHHSVAANKKVVAIENSVNINFETDPTLLNRILLNMLKNAIEASPKESIISIKCRIENDTIHFDVNNPTYIPQKRQLQIFQRSFSTKGPDRGLGTYSMKLLGEKYLKGKVDFTSSKNKGTVFTLSLPLTSN